MPPRVAIDRGMCKRAVSLRPATLEWPITRSGPKLPAGKPAGILRFKPAVMDQHPHCPDLRQRFPDDLPSDVDIAPGDPDRIAGQPHNALDVGLRGFAGEMKNGDLPPFRPPEIV